jgi:acyl transferase domain-containing protein
MPYLNDHLAIAAINETDQSVIAGETAAIEALSIRLTAAGVNCRRLHTSHAFHSPMMEPILADFAECVARIALHAPTIPYLSNVTGDWITAQAATSPAYWVAHLRQSVQFAAGLTTLRSASDLLIEVGPGRTLATFARRHADYDPATVFTSLRHPQEEQSDEAHLLSTLGQLWQQGITIDWDNYYANETRQRISLPTYPFARQRHWIEPTAAQKAAHGHQTDASTPTRQPIQDWFYVPTWQQAPLPRRGLTTAQQWLLFIDETGLGAALATALRQAGQEVIIVQAGAAFAQLSADGFTIRPAESDDYMRLWQALPFTPQRIVHLWNVSATAVMEQPTTATLLAEAQQTALSSFYTLLYFAQSLGQQQVTTAIDLCLITDQLYNITGSEPVQTSKALLLGPLQVLPQEYPNLTCRLVDVGPALSAGNRQTIINHLLTEFATQGEEQVIAYRGSHRWLASTQPMRLPESTLTLRHGAVYLITGGLGGIGLTLAETLAAAQPTLVLLGRSAFPARSTWADWLADHGPTDPTSQQISRLQGLETAGATLFIQAVDVSDQVAMQAVIAEVRHRFGAIHGVIHAAGIGGANLIAQRNDAALAAVLAPKVQGTLVLEALLHDQPLDFFVLCSSLSAFLGGVGQVAYTAANAFQDAFAQSRAQRYPCLSLNWDAWREVGNGRRSICRRPPGRTPQADYGLYPTQGQQLFGQALASGLPQLLISTLDFAQLRRHLRQPEQLPTLTASSKQDRPNARHRLCGTAHAGRKLAGRYLANLSRDCADRRSG